MSVPVPDAWTLTSPAHANSRSLPASTCRRRSLCVKCYGVNAPESSFYPMVNANQRVHTQLPCWPERWQLNIWVTPWMGWWFPCHLLEAASRRKHSCLQWDDCTFIGLLLLLYIPASLLVHPESSVALTLFSSGKSLLLAEPGLNQTI